MVGDDGNRMCGFLEILIPFLQCQDHCKEFAIIDIVVSLGGGEGVEVVSTGV